MSKKPMYLKRRAGSKFLLLAIVLLLIFVAWHFLPQTEQGLAIKVTPELQDRSFKSKPEEIFAPRSDIKAYYLKQDGKLTVMSFVFRQSGSAYEKEGQSGIANIVAETIKEGAGWWSAKELRNLMGAGGIKMVFSATKDDFVGQISFPDERRQEAIKYLREILINPHFEDKYVNAAKAEVLRTIEAEKEDPETELSLAFDKVLFGNSTYGKNQLGNIDDIVKIDRRDLMDFVKNNLGRNKMFVGIVGSLSKEDAIDMLDNAFARLPIIEEKELDIPAIDWQQKPTYISRDSSQNIVMYAALGTCRQCADFYPLYIADYILGGAGLNSRFNQTLRENENLTYGVSSWLDINDKSKMIMASFAATPDNINKAKDLFNKLWSDAGKYGFSQEELDKAKDYLVASHNLRFASSFGIAEMLSYMQKYDLGIDFLSKRNEMVKNVTLQQLNDVAAKYFKNNPIVAEIGKNNN